MRAWRTRFYFLALAIFLLPAGALTASSQKGKNKHARHADYWSGVETHAAVDRFADRDRDVIRQYYAGNPGSLPPGLAKRGGNLPPGLQKQMQRKGHLPPGLEKRLVAFPVELEHQLPPPRCGLMRGMIDGRAVIYDPKTSVILDICLVF